MPTKINVNARKLPKQQRSGFTVEAILQAATQVLTTQGLAGFNTNQIALRAGVSIGTLYQYFPNKSALIAQLITREQLARCAQIEGLVGQTFAALRPALHALVGVAIDHQFASPAYAWAIDQEEVRLPLQAELSAFQHRIGKAIQQVLRKHRQEIGSPISTTVVLDCITITKAMVDSSPSAHRLQARVVRALYGYLLAK
jgi:AcrR family transcriptional regulator